MMCSENERFCDKMHGKCKALPSDMVQDEFTAASTPLAKTGNVGKRFATLAVTKYALAITQMVGK